MCKSLVLVGPTGSGELPELQDDSAAPPLNAIFENVPHFESRVDS